ncbi:Pcc1 domain-containing protein [Trichoderma pleuroticola]
MSSDPKFPCSIQLRIPFPTPRLASTALKALQVDPELSPLVQRHLSVVSSSSSSTSPSSDDHAEVLQVEYQATTNRMLRVAVNSFMEGLKLVLEVMEQLDVDVLAADKANSIKSP